MGFTIGGGFGFGGGGGLKSPLTQDIDVNGYKIKATTAGASVDLVHQAAGFVGVYREDASTNELQLSTQAGADIIWAYTAGGSGTFGLWADNNLRMNINGSNSTGFRTNSTQCWSYLPLDLNGKGITNLLNAELRGKAAVSVTSITRSGSTATVTTSAAHGYSTSDIIDISGANEADYNGQFSITVSSTTVFTYTVGGSPTTPATGTIIAHENVDPSTVADSTHIYSKHIAGIAETFVQDEGGTATQISAHSRMAPDSLYDEDDGTIDMVVQEIQWYLGFVRFTNKTRMGKLMAMTDVEKSALTAEQRACVVKESFAEFNTRTGAGLVAKDWDIDQQAKQTAKDSARAVLLARRDALVAEQDTFTVPQDIASYGKLIEEVDQDLEQYPEGNIKKPKPSWLA